MIAFNIKINTNELNNEIRKETSKVVIKSIKKVVASIKQPISEIVKESLLKSPFVKEAIDGKLGAELGLPAIGRAELFENLINDIVDTLVINYVVRNNSSVIASITISMQREDYNNILSQDYATVITDKGFPLEWLRWVLFEGDSIIIYDYDVKFTASKGRSGIAIMAKNYGEGDFRVDPIHSGTQYDNWITRVLNNYILRDKISQILETTFKQFLK